MLLVRDEQIAILWRVMNARFEQEACEHVRRYFPDRCASLGDQGTTDKVHNGLIRARNYGFETRYDLLRFLNLVFQFGPEFEGAEWARPYLEAAQRSPAIHMDRLMEEAMSRLFPTEPAPAAPAPEEEEEEVPDEFDGIMWEPAGVDPSYVPTSVKPEYEPIDRPIKPGSIPVDQLPQAVEDEDGVPIEPEEDEEEEGDGRG